MKYQWALKIIIINVILIIIIMKGVARILSWG